MSVVMWKGKRMMNESGSGAARCGEENDAGAVEHSAFGGAPDAAGAIAVAPERGRVDAAVAAAREWLIVRQDAAGWWCAELEGDTTLESYMILLEAFFGRPDGDKARAL